MARRVRSRYAREEAKTAEVSLMSRWSFRERYCRASAEEAYRRGLQIVEVRQSSKVERGELKSVPNGDRRDCMYSSRGLRGLGRFRALVDATGELGCSSWFAGELVLKGPKRRSDRTPKSWNASPRRTHENGAQVLMTCPTRVSPR